MGGKHETDESGILYIERYAKNAVDRAEPRTLI